MLVELYARKDCVFCGKVRAWFARHQIPYIEHTVSGVDDFARMQERLPGARSIPQVVIDDHLIGGLDTLLRYEGPLLERLKGPTPPLDAAPAASPSS
ncbi:glutaredoxin family protein [Pararhodospirillum oryzae]|uniref:Glutaredoxin domain-containing protein n=1 Tax=Pararhodospirillum oryzae TaxID=478448 RepID=A0A512HBF8_9PROT|nr:glutaredoxin [Pararhodospirillum oryzae]GEO82787.1 hypothetical protein ROR02_29180 [Pararhodospirillum oryzae]